MSLENTIETTLNQIQKVMGTNSVIGTAISTKDKVIIPISKVAMGFGVGTANNNGDSETAVGGAGGGGSIDPVAFLIIYNNIPGPDGVQLITVDGNNSLDDILESAGKFVFDLISNSSSGVPATKKDGDHSNIDKIKTKIKK